MPLESGPLESGPLESGPLESGPPESASPEPGRGARLLLSALGLGWLPWMPGTWASAATAVLVVGSEVLLRGGLVAAAGLFLLGTAVTLAFGGAARDPTGGGDPGWVVSDEVAGQSLASAAALYSGTWLPAAAAFVLFRLLDILKPPPIRQAESAPGGLGVLLDDLVAGLVAAGAVFLLRSADLLG